MAQDKEVVQQASGGSVNAVKLPDDFQDKVFKAIAVQRPAVGAYIKEVRRKNPAASPAQVMKIIESQYVATTTAASAAVGASATIPAVGVPVALGLGVADLLFFYETTALFALCMAELRGIPIDDPDRAKVIVLGALLGEKRRSPVSQIVLSALPAGATVAGARAVAGGALSGATPKWGDLLAQQIPDSALVPVTMVLARQAIAQGTVMGAVKISSKAIPVIGAVAGGATSFYFGSGVVKSCRAGFSEPAEVWPEWLELADSDGDGIPDPSKAVLAMRAASESAKDFGENVWGRIVDSSEVFRSVDIDGDGIPDEARAVTAVKGAATTVGAAAGGAAKAVGGAAGGAVKAVGGVATGAAGAVTGLFKRGKSANDNRNNSSGEQAAEPESDASSN
ncbi:hypothetical protein [Microbacterium sp. p3-SID336]|uniref:hypothetical protein n=1 Tax=Microbacterium sp. p3-SID336 TaxID=2916212 RepID=UPI0021A74C23|nr:hypothetical protein [Microbacterium sp. p3-SID336]MCT1477461.1 hypothetical protein [Microbacterium sp. p3-SID336]